MKILILAHAQYVTVGLPKIIEYSETLVRKGHDVTLMVTSLRNKFRMTVHHINGVCIVESPSWMAGKLRHGVDLWDSVRRIWWLRRQHFDVVHCVAARPTVLLPGLYMKYRHKVPMIYEWEDLFGNNGTATVRSGKLYAVLLGWIEGLLERKMLDVADGVITVSSYLTEQTQAAGVPANRVLFQPKGTKYAEPDFLVPVYHSNKDHIVLTYVGTIYQTDLNLLFDAFSYAMRRYDQSRPVILQLVGYNQELPKRRPGNVTIYQRLPEQEFLERIEATDLFILPLTCSASNIARCPSKFADYLAFGRPVVATPVPDIRAVVETSQCGFVASDDSAKSLGTALLRALNERERWMEYGRNGRQFVEKYRHWDNIADNITSFYSQIMEIRFDIKHQPVDFYEQKQTVEHNHVVNHD